MLGWRVASINLVAAWGVTLTTWTLLWTTLAAATVALVVLFRTRWNHVRPWRKCAVLSLWVHVLLACLTMTVRIVSGSAGQGPDETMQVAILPPEAIVDEPSPQEPDVEDPEELAPDFEQAADPPLIEPPTPPLADPDTEASDRRDESAEPAAALDAAALEAPVESATDTPTPAPATPLEAPPLTPAPELPEESQAPSETGPTEPPPTDDQEAAAQPAESAPVAPRTQPPAPNIPAELAGRFAEDRRDAVVRGGGNAATEQAVRSALAWLAGAQSDDGRWDASRHGAGDERIVLGHDRQRAGANADTGVTGLAVLAFLGAGHTHQRGSYPARVAEGLEYLRRSQASDGNVYGDAHFFARMYCHSMAAFALAEALALSEDAALAPAVERATAFSLAAQHPADGGWRYRPGNTGDTSQLGWQLMALRSAELAGVEIPAATWTGVERFLRRVRRGQTGGLAAYRPDAAPSRSMTAEAFYCRQLIAHRFRGHTPATAAREATTSLLRTVPAARNANLYYWYYATLALHHARHDSPAAATAWQTWNDALVHALLTTQSDDGSWPATTVWGGYGGRVYTTAMAALCLEVYYRYDPAAGEPSVPPGVAGRSWRPVR